MTDVTHPEFRELTRFGQGCPDLAASSRIEGHIANCETCQRTLERIPPGPFIKLLKSVADTGERPALALQFEYELLGEISGGGMGVLYRALQSGLNRVVAV